MASCRVTVKGFAKESVAEEAPFSGQSVSGVQPAASQPCMIASLISGNPTPALPQSPVFHIQVYKSSRPLRIGYYETDNYTRPTPAMRRALLETKKSLEAAGHTVWLWSPFFLVPMCPGLASCTHIAVGRETVPWHQCLISKQVLEGLLVNPVLNWGILSTKEQGRGHWVDCWGPS